MWATLQHIWDNLALVSGSAVGGALVLPAPAKALWAKIRGTAAADIAALKDQLAADNKAFRDQVAADTKAFKDQLAQLQQDVAALQTAAAPKAA